MHQPQNTLHAVIDKAKGPRLLAIAPDIQFISIFARRRLPAKGSGRLFSTASPRAIGPVDIMESSNASDDVKVSSINHRHLLGVQLFKSIGVLRPRGPRIRLLEARIL